MRNVHIPSGASELEGQLSVPRAANGIVIFAYGADSSRLNPRNQLVAQVLNGAGIGTLLFDFLTSEEEETDARTCAMRCDIELLSTRLEHASNWISAGDNTRHLRIGYFGASAGAGAALTAAARLGKKIAAVVSRGGRPDLAGQALSNVMSPTLLLVGSQDEPILQINESALAQLRCEKRLQVVPGATHLFEEFGTLEEAAHLAAEWFGRHLPSRSKSRRSSGKRT
jgi:dienelactone hydrolase